MNRRRYDALMALANDPGATPAERRLAGERAAEFRASYYDRHSEPPPAYVELDVDDDLLAAFDGAMARTARVGNRAFRDARTRAARHRLGRDAQRAWEQHRGRGLGR